MWENNDMLARYLKDISYYPLITPDREKELARIIHGKSSTDEAKYAARQELVLGNLRLVVPIALKLYQKISGLEDMNLSLMDLIQAGNIGIMRAADLFLAEKGNKFSTYAHLSAERKMVKLVKESRLIRIPQNYFKHMHDIDVIKEKYGDLDDKSLAKKLHIMEETLKVVKDGRFSRVNTEDINVLMERVDSKDSPLAEVLNHQNRRSYVFEKLKELNPRQQQVLFYMYFSNREMTYEAIAQKIGVTRERVRQILEKALYRIRKKIEEDTFHKRLKLVKTNKGGKK